MLICGWRGATVLVTTEGMERITYDIRTTDGQVEFVRLVNTHIGNDWQPLGGLTAAPAGACQAMVRD